MLERPGKGVPVPDQDETQGAQLRDGIRQKLRTALEDRAVFPSTRDVVRAFNEAFGSRFEYSAFCRHGRAPLVRKALRWFDGLTEERKAEGLKRLFHSGSAGGPRGDTYRQLFEILIRNGK